MFKRVPVVCLLCICLFLAACGQGSSPQNDPEKMQLTIATMPSIDKVPLVIGMEKGFFAAHGLEVINQNFQSPGDRDAALSSGSLDGVMTDLVALAFYLEAGMNWKVTSLVQTGFAVLASPGSGIKHLSDIEPSHTYGISLNGLIEYVADQAGSAQKILLPPVSSRVEQLLADRIDLTVVPEPYGLMAVKNGATMVATDADLDIRAAVMIFSDEAISGKRDAISAFYAGYKDSLDYLQTADPGDYIDLVIEKGDFAAEIGEVLRNMVFDPLQMPQDEQFFAVIDWMRQNEELTGRYYFSFADIVEDSFFK